MLWWRCFNIFSSNWIFVEINVRYISYWPIAVYRCFTIHGYKKKIHYECVSGFHWRCWRKSGGHHITDIEVHEKSGCCLTNYLYITFGSHSPSIYLVHFTQTPLRHSSSSRLFLVLLSIGSLQVSFSSILDMHI